MEMLKARDAGVRDSTESIEKGGAVGQQYGADLGPTSPTAHGASSPSKAARPSTRMQPLDLQRMALGAEEEEALPSPSPATPPDVAQRSEGERLAMLADMRAMVDSTVDDTGLGGVDEAEQFVVASNSPWLSAGMDVGIRTAAVSDGVRQCHLPDGLPTSTAPSGCPPGEEASTVRPEIEANTEQLRPSSLTGTSAPATASSGSLIYKFRRPGSGPDSASRKPEKQSEQDVAPAVLPNNLEAEELCTAGNITNLPVQANGTPRSGGQREGREARSARAAAAPVAQFQSPIQHSPSETAHSGGSRGGSRGSEPSLAAAQPSRGSVPCASAQPTRLSERSAASDHHRSFDVEDPAQVTPVISAMCPCL